MASLPAIGLITPGDPQGIGPEIVVKTIFTPGSRSQRNATTRKVIPVLIGALNPFWKYRKQYEVYGEDSELPRSPTRHQIQEIARNLIAREIKRPLFLAAPEGSPGFQSGWAVQFAADLCMELQQAGVRTGLATGPISKERINEAGFKFPGHTELLAHRAGLKADDVTMMLAGPRLRVSLVTIHTPLKKVSRELTVARLERTVKQTFEVLSNQWKISRPHVAVCGLNPHAGENGLLGTEERELITPILRKLRRSHGGRFEGLSGPHPSDTLFAGVLSKTPPFPYDAVVCHYHDQGLIPAKLVDFSQTVNMTLGLPFIRTSVDHGVAFDIAGKSKADPTSFRCAWERLGELLVLNKNK